MATLALQSESAQANPANPVLATAHFGAALAFEDLGVELEQAEALAHLAATADGLDVHHANAIRAISTLIRCARDRARACEERFTEESRRLRLGVVPKAAAITPDPLSSADAAQARDGSFRLRHGSWRMAEDEFEQYRGPEDSAQWQDRLDRAFTLRQEMLGCPVWTASSLMMKFSALKDACPASQIAVELPSGVTVFDVIQQDLSRISNIEMGLDAALTA